MDMPGTQTRLNEFICSSPSGERSRFSPAPARQANELFFCELRKLTSYGLFGDIVEIRNPACVKYKPIDA
jgi:hypothetical protein